MQFKEFFRKNKKIIVPAGIALLGILLIVSAIFGFKYFNNDKKGEKTSKSVTPTTTPKEEVAKPPASENTPQEEKKVENTTPVKEKDTSYMPTSYSSSSSLADTLSVVNEDLIRCAITEELGQLNPLNHLNLMDEIQQLKKDVFNLLKTPFFYETKKRKKIYIYRV